MSFSVNLPRFSKISVNLPIVVNLTNFIDLYSFYGFYRTKPQFFTNLLTSGVNFNHFIPAKP
jgi:hypothetical protein